MSKSKPARSVRLRSARKARSKKAVGHQPQTKFSSTSHDEGVSWRRALAKAAEEARLTSPDLIPGSTKRFDISYFFFADSSCLFFCVSCCFILWSVCRRAFLRLSDFVARDPLATLAFSRLSPPFAPWDKPVPGEMFRLVGGCAFGTRLSIKNRTK